MTRGDDMVTSGCAVNSAADPGCTERHAVTTVGLCQRSRDQQKSLLRSVFLKISQTSSRASVNKPCPTCFLYSLDGNVIRNDNQYIFDFMT